MPYIDEFHSWNYILNIADCFVCIATIYINTYLIYSNIYLTKHI